LAGRREMLVSGQSVAAVTQRVRRTASEYNLSTQVARKDHHATTSSSVVLALLTIFIRRDIH